MGFLIKFLRESIIQSIREIALQQNIYFYIYEKEDKYTDYEFDFGSFSHSMHCQTFLRFPKDHESFEITASVFLTEDQAEHMQFGIPGITGDLKHEIQCISYQQGIYPEYVLDADAPFLFGWTKLFFEDYTRTRFFEIVQKITLWSEVIRFRIKAYFEMHDTVFPRIVEEIQRDKHKKRRLYI